MEEAHEQIAPEEDASAIQGEPSEIPQPPDMDVAGKPPGKRRGRPPGSGKKTVEQIEEGASKPGAAKQPGKRKSASFDRAQLELMGKQLVGLHAIAAMATGIPEVQIAENEGFALAQGIANVCEQYNLAIDGKTGAMLQLLGTAAMIYGPRYFALQKRVRAAQSNIVPAGDAQASAH